MGKPENKPTKNIVIFASGSGTNAQAIIDYFAGSSSINVHTVLSNKREARVLDRAEKAGVAAISFNRTAFAKAGSIHKLLQAIKPDLIVLAGFLWKVPAYLVLDFPDQIINLHPSLLPKYGGKGMYGAAVHEAVIKNKESQSGITIHYVNEEYDQGDFIEQYTCEVLEDDTPTSLANRIHHLEHRHLPFVIEKLLNGK